MHLTSSTFEDNAPIPARCAFCSPDPDSHVTFSGNRNPQIAWNNVPTGCKSLVLICHDPDVPSKPDDVNQEERTVPKELPRIDFYHWVLVDIPADQSSIAEAAYSEGVTPKGKPGPQTLGAMRHGANDYTNWFAGDPDMGGTYYGYDGPCPPWNDSIVHHYVFTLYALDIDRCPVENGFTGKDVLAAIEGHVLAQASLTGTYCLNPAVES